MIDKWKKLKREFESHLEMLRDPAQNNYFCSIDIVASKYTTMFILGKLIKGNYNIEYVKYEADYDNAYLITIDDNEFVYIEPIWRLDGNKDWYCLEANNCATYVEGRLSSKIIREQDKYHGKFNYEVFDFRKGY